MSLKRQSIYGVLWSFIDAILLKGLFFAASIFLARILGPSEFGLMGMIAMFIAIGATLVDGGLSSSLIRDNDVADIDYSTVFFLNLAICIVVYLSFYFLAPFISDFYNEIILVKMIRIYCLTFVISAFANIHIARLSKQMNFKKMMILNIPGTLISISLGIFLALRGYGVWSLIYMYLVNQIVQVGMLWGFGRWKPRFVFSKERAKYHYGFGYRLMLSGLINTLFDNVYNIVVGKFFLVKSLGLFERAKAFSDYPVTVFTGVISKVSFPLLAQVKDDKKRIAYLYKQLMTLSFFIITPIMMMAAAVAKPLFILLLGLDWLSAVPFFKILCLGGIFYPIHAYNINVLKVYGRSDLFLRLELIKKIVIVVCVASLFWFGILGVAWSSVISSLIALIINSYYSGKMIDYSSKEQFFDFIPIIVTSSFMYLIMSIIRYFLDTYSNYIQVILPIICGAVFYLAINILIKASPLLFALSLIKNKKYDSSY